SGTVLVQLLEDPGVLDRVRAISRHSRNRLDRPGGGVRGPLRAPVARRSGSRVDGGLKRLGGNTLGVRVDRQGDVVALLGDAADLVEDRGELVALPAQPPVLGALDPRLADLDEAVADRVAEQRSLRVAAYVDRVLAAPD